MTKRLLAFQAQVFQALAHPTRIAIVEALRDGDVNASVLPGRLQVEAAQVSLHLTVLRTQQLVQLETRGSHVYYSLTDPRVLRAMDVIKESFYIRVGQSAVAPTDSDSKR